jgi:hypothetical protein
MVSHPPLNHSKLHTLFQALRISITQRFWILFGEHRITWLVLAYERIATNLSFVLSVSLFVSKIKSVFVDLVQDPALLEFAWVELLEKHKSVTTEELAEVLLS